MSAMVGNLKEASLLDIENLIELYSKHLPYTSLSYNFLNIARKWEGMNLKIKHITIYLKPDDNESGTFVAVLQFHCVQILSFTLDKSCTYLHDVLRIVVDNWRHENLLFFAVHEDHRDTVYKVLNSFHMEILYDDLNILYWMRKEAACELSIECPANFYIKPLEPSDAEHINNNYPHKCEDSENYLRTLIKLNGGHGIYRTEDDNLVAWAIRNQIGILGMVTTIESCKRKGFGSVITKSLSRQIGSDGFNSMGTVINTNVPSRQMFQKLGFSELAKVHYIECCPSTEV